MRRGGEPAAIRIRDPRPGNAPAALAALVGLVVATAACKEPRSSPCDALRALVRTEMASTARLRKAGTTAFAGHARTLRAVSAGLRARAWPLTVAAAVTQYRAALDGLAAGYERFADGGARVSVAAGFQLTFHGLAIDAARLRIAERCEGR